MLIGIDWGGTKIEGVALTEDGKELTRRREPTPRHDYNGCIQLIAGLVQKIEQETGKTGSIGIGIPGSLDPKSRLGKGVAVGGRAHHGPNNNAGEWGHNPLPFPDITEIPGPPCFCGKHSCLASWVSGLGFQDDYQRHAGIQIAADDIIRKMRSGDRLARLVWRRYVNRLARGLSLVVNALDPDIFVMGGGMSNVDELYTDLPTELSQYTFSRGSKRQFVKRYS